VQTTCVTFIACFLSFYLAEFTSLHVSGILSLVVLGLYLSATGKTKIYPESEHALHVVWSFVQYVCETLIFLLTGVIIGVKVIEETSITVSDWIRMIVFWFLMQFMRLVMLACSLPVLSNFGYPVNRKEFIVLVYGGLRGALGLSLALMVYVDDTIHNERFQELTLFYMSGMAAITLLVNGTTCGPLVNYLQMVYVPAIKNKLYLNCKTRIEK
jgi:NhaP-type Na+/H+ or K+/H+ antiporter